MPLYNFVRESAGATLLLAYARRTPCRFCEVFEVTLARSLNSGSYPPGSQPSDFANPCDKGACCRRRHHAFELQCLSEPVQAISPVLGFRLRDGLVMRLPVRRAAITSDSSGDGDGGDDACTNRDDGRASSGSGSCGAISSGDAGDVAARASGDDDDNGPFEQMIGPLASSCSSSVQPTQHRHRSSGRQPEMQQADC